MRRRELGLRFERPAERRLGVCDVVPGKQLEALRNPWRGLARRRSLRASARAREHDREAGKCQKPQAAATVPQPRRRRGRCPDRERDATGSPSSKEARGSAVGHEE